MVLLSYTNGLSRIPNGLNKSSNIKVLVCTGNIGNEEPNDESINEWIPRDGSTKLVLQNQKYPINANNGKTNPTESLLDNGREHDTNGVSDDEQFDIIAIGMQEATFDLREASKSKMSATFQKVTHVVEQATRNENYNKVKRSPSKKSKRFLGKDEQLSSIHERRSTLPEEKDESSKEFDYGRGRDDTRFLHQTLGYHLPSYTRGVSFQRGQMRLMIFYIEDNISLDVISVKAQNTGRAGLANKGGIVAECNVNEGTRISFLTAHLEAHEGLTKYNTRCSTIGDIFRGTSSLVADHYCDLSLTSHFMFAMGDLNFRTRLPDFEMGSEEHLADSHRLAKERDWDTLNKYDELSLALREKKCLARFSTPRCDFPPTFKVERKDGYRYISKRSPSYTDRILYNANHRLLQNVSLLAYEPIDHFTTSDHKPIRGAFEIQLNQKLKFKPILSRKLSRGNRLTASTSAFRVKVRKILGKGSDTSDGTSGKVSCENFHIFISSIQCDIAKEEYSGLIQTPSPCISFVAAPTDAMKPEGETEDWNTWYRKNTAKIARDLNAPVPIKGTTRWPCTEPIPNTFSPHWEDEINFKVRTHLESGTPVDLTGAMLHIMVHDTKDSMKLIGSCSFNLASLIISSFSDEELHTKTEQSGTAGGISLASSIAARLRGKSKPKNPSESRKRGVLNQKTPGEVELDRQKSVMQSDMFVSEAIGDNLLQSTTFASGKSPSCKEILTKNGKVVGRVKFNIDTWWLNDDKFSTLSVRKDIGRKQKRQEKSNRWFWPC